MSVNPMEVQIGRIVGNMLAGGGEVFLPGVGSLYTERQGAKRINRRTVQPPCRIVAFTPEQRGLSLVDEIARIMRENGCGEPAAEAQAVYDRWIGRVHRANLLSIEGVGELRFRSFTPDEAFDLRLNPQGHEPVRIPVRRRFDWALWIGVAAIGVALVYGGREFLMLYSAEPESAVQMSLAAPPDTLQAVQAPDALAEAPAAEPSAAEPVSEPEAEAAAAGTEPAPAAVVPLTESKAQQTPMGLLAGRHYVVLGVFSTPENAARAVREAVAKEPSFRCRIYYFGEKFMVSPFSSDESAVCRQFIGAQSGRFPGMWIYTAR